MSEPFDPSRLPSKRIGAGVLLRDTHGQILLVDPTYKDLWEIPGGLVEPGESPREAAGRECREELGVDLPIGRPVCIHYAEGARTPGDGIMFVFDAGITETPAEAFTLPPDELRAARFVPVDELEQFLHEVMVVRLRSAVDAAERDVTTYLER